jgi:hypothetical protein
MLNEHHRLYLDFSYHSIFEVEYENNLDIANNIDRYCESTMQIIGTLVQLLVN